jgi:serine/threonine protein kinase
MANLLEKLSTALAGRYRIEREIGRGGMATVYRATDLELGEEVALKVFRQPLDDAAALARFKQELRLSRRLVHPNIARLYDIGVHLGHRYISMELLVGRGLDSQMGRPLELRKGVGYLLQACAALQAAHNEGVVHRDVKPANMFVTVDEHVKVMDFGIAKQREARGMTVTGMVIGTPEYMSPEQIRGFSSVTEAADIYALGVVAYEMFTGTVPFKHDDLMPLLMMQLESAPEPPRYRNGAITPELETVIMQLLQKDPRQRFASCDALAEALRRLKL